MKKHSRQEYLGIAAICILVAILGSIIVLRVLRDKAEQSLASDSLAAHSDNAPIESDDPIEIVPPAVYTIPTYTPDYPEVWNDDVQAESEETDIEPEHDARADDQSSSRFSGIELTEEDKELLARLVFCEARGEEFDGQVAVVEVVLNRVLSEHFPDTVEGVIYQRLGSTWQFSPAPILSTVEPTEQQYEAVEAAITGDTPLTSEETVFFSRKPYNEFISATIGNHVFCEWGN